MKNKSVEPPVTRDYLSFSLLKGRTKIALLNIDAEETLLYDVSDDGVFNSYLDEFRDKRLRIKLVQNAGKWQIISSREILINGVAWRKRILKEGDTLHIGKYRLIFQGQLLEDIPRVSENRKNKNQKKFIKIIEAAAIIGGVSFLWFCTTYNGNQPIHNPNISNSTAVVHETELPYESTEELDDINRDSSSIDSAGLIVYGSGEAMVSSKLDILFIHAHPDDESLDYGLYIAKEASLGKSVGVVLFTDGDSGFDKYPDRPVDGFYQDSYLKGNDLAVVREQEAENALTQLGADIYIHLGLWNRPYTRTEASKSVETISEEWGGEEFLIKTLLNIFSTFNPDIIVSPDGPSTAREHFEHEAVGYIVEKAVDRYIDQNKGSLKAYLQLVDVEQTGCYSNRNLIEINSDKNEVYIEKKKAALMRHQTQADASFFGIKRLNNFPVEYYFISYLSSDIVASGVDGASVIY